MGKFWSPRPLVMENVVMFTGLIWVSDLLLDEVKAPVTHKS